MINPSDAPRLAAASIIAIPAFFKILIAEISQTVEPSWIGSITQISAFGLVAWIVFFMFTKWLPSMQESAALQLKEQRDAHVAAMTKVSDAHAKAMQDVSDSHKDAVTHLTSAFENVMQTQRNDLIALIKGNKTS